MKSSIIFKLFSILASGVLFTNIISDLNSSSIPFLQILMQAGLILILLELAFKSQITTPKNEASKIEPYHFIFSKIGLGTVMSSFIIQNFMI
jgi:hypothetical protein